MIKISKMSDYAVLILIAMAEKIDGLMSVAAISERTGLSEPTVSKVLKMLGKSNIVKSSLGANGGYSIVSPLKEISAADVITAVEGSVSITSCVGGVQPDCPVADSCNMRGRWDKVNNAIRATLEGVILSDMVPSASGGKSGEYKNGGR